MVALSEWSLSLVPELFRACQDETLSRQLPSLPSPYTRESALDFVSRTAPSFSASGGANFAVLDSGRLAGCVSVRRLAPGAGRLGYWVAPDFRGRGVASQATCLASQWAASAGFGVLELTIARENLASLRVAARAGFTLAEELPGFEISPGVFMDTLRLTRSV